MKATAFVLYLVFVLSWFTHLTARVPALGALRLDLLLVLLVVLMGGLRGDGSRRQGGVAPTGIRTLLVLLFAYVLLTAPLVEWPGSVLKNGLPTLLKAIVFYLFTVYLVDDERRLAWLLTVFVGCQLFRVFEPTYLHLTMGYWGDRANVEGGEWMARLSGAPHDVVNPNGLAWVALTALSFAHYLLPLTRLGRLLYLAVLPVLLYALVLTGSRSGFIGLVGVVGVVWYNSRHRLLFGGTLLAVAIAFVTLLPQWSPDLADRYRSIYSSETKNASTAQSRIRGVAGDLEVALRRPLFGHGLGTSLEANANFGARALPSHNLYMEVAQELGFVGLLLFLVFLVAVTRGTVRTLRRLRSSANASAMTFAVAKAIQVWLFMNLLFSFASYGLTSYEWYFLAGLAETQDRFLVQRPSPCSAQHL